MKTKKPVQYSTYHSTRHPSKHSIKSDTWYLHATYWNTSVVQLDIWCISLYDFCLLVTFKRNTCQRHHVYFSSHRFITINMMFQLKSYLFERNSIENASESIVNRNYVLSVCLWLLLIKFTEKLQTKYKLNHYINTNLPYGFDIFKSKYNISSFYIRFG